jgi:hypothetical protein
MWLLIAAFVYFGFLRPLVKCSAELNRLKKSASNRATLKEERVKELEFRSVKEALDHLEIRYQIMADPNVKRNPLGLPVALFPDDHQRWLESCRADAEFFAKSLKQ